MIKPNSRKVAAARIEISPSSQQTRMRRPQSGNCRSASQLQLSARQVAGRREYGPRRTHDVRAHPAPRLHPLSRRERIRADEGNFARRFRQNLADGLAAIHVGAQRLGEMGGEFEIEAAHHRYERSAVALLQAGIGGDLLAQGRAGLALIVVRRMDFQRGIELQHPAEQAVIKRVRIAGGKIGAPGAPDQQRVAGEDAVFHHQTHRIPGMAGRVQRPEASWRPPSASRRHPGISPHRARATGDGLRQGHSESGPFLSLRKNDRHGYECPAHSGCAGHDLPQGEV